MTSTILKGTLVVMLHVWQCDQLIVANVACVIGWQNTSVRLSTPTAKNELSRSTPPIYRPKPNSVTFLSPIDFQSTSSLTCCLHHSRYDVPYLFVAAWIFANGFSARDVASFKTQHDALDSNIWESVKMFPAVIVSIRNTPYCLRSWLRHSSLRLVVGSVTKVVSVNWKSSAGF